MKNTTSTRRKSIFLKKLGMLAVFSPIFLSLFSACADTEPIDEDETDPSINPPITFVEDDEETPTEADGIKYRLPLAFPGAEGYGRDTKGARNSDKIEIYHVRNTNNGGTGSFKDAISESNRIIIFDVAGVINMNKEVYVLKSNQTILFQTAPGDGIELYNGRVSSSGASHLIVRYMRMRTGRQADGGDNMDAGGVANGEYQIYDHCSFTWGCDENFSINPDGKGTRPQNITLQNSIIGQGCMNHSCGGLIQTNENEGITIFRNLLIDNKTRNFKVKGLNQYVNNVVYNWGNGAAYNMGGESAGTSNTTIVNNYFIKGPGWTWQNYKEADVDPNIIGDETQCSPSSDGYYEVLGQVNPTKPFIGGDGDGDFKTYCIGNFYDANKDGILNGIEITQSNWDTYCSASPVFLNTPSYKHKTIWAQTDAKKAYEWIVKYVGASLPARDHVDAFMIDELTSLGEKGTIFRDQRKIQQYPLANTWQNINTVNNKPLDTDGDGIPDDWEDANGLNKNDPSDALIIPEGQIYTWIEIYANSLVPEEGIYIENK